MSRDASKGRFLYEAEASWCEDAAFSSPIALATLNVPDVSGLTWGVVPSYVTQYRNEYAMPVRVGKGGSFTTEHWLAGHGSSTAGAGLSLSALETLLGIVIGNAALSAAAGTTITAAADADSFTTAASGTFTPGLMAFLGVARDTRGGAQPVICESHTLTAFEAETAAPAAPTNGDVLAAAGCIYPSESGAGSITSTRWRLLTANQTYLARGVFPMSMELTTDRGQPPRVRITWGVSYWEEYAGTFPDATAAEAHVPAPHMTGGSLFVQTHGTKTRDAAAVRTTRNLSINITLGIAPQRGYGGVFEWQEVVGAVRTPDEVTISWVEDAETATASPVAATDWQSDTEEKHILVGFNNAESGKRVGFYARKAKRADNQPVQSAEDGINVIRRTYRACADTAGTNDATRSAYLLGLG